MKKKNFNKRLLLNKKTISNIGKAQMPLIKGGVATELEYCTEYPEGGCPKTIAETRFWTCN